MPGTRKNPSRPFVGVGAVVFKGLKILLVKRGRAPKEGEWSLPGGGQKLGETVIQALHREILEETGLTIKIGQLLGVVDFIEPGANPAKNAVSYHYTLIDYAADYVSGELVAMSDTADARFFSLDEALCFPLWTETKRIIQLAAAARGLYPKDPP